MKRHARLAKLDESTDYRRLRPVLLNVGFDVRTVESQGLKGAPDAQVIRAAADEGAILVTHDPDMADRRRAGVRDAVVIVLRPGRHGADVSAQILREVVDTIDIVALPRGALVVAGPGNIRIVFPS